MIILLNSDNPVNQKAIEGLKKENGETKVSRLVDLYSIPEDEKKLILLALSNDKTFQIHIKPEILAKRLVRKLSSITEIDVIASDPDRSLFSFCLTLAEKLGDEKKNITIRSTANLERPVVVAPPQNGEGNWLISTPEGKLVFTDKTIGNYLACQMITPEEIEGSKQLAECSINPHYQPGR